MKGPTQNVISADPDQVLDFNSGTVSPNKQKLDTLPWWELSGTLVWFTIQFIQKTSEKSHRYPDGLVSTPQMNRLAILRGRFSWPLGKFKIKLIFQTSELA